MSLLRVRHLFPANTDCTLSDVHIDRSRRLGSGAFGEVFAANWKGCRVAAKKIHDVFFDEKVVPAEECTKILLEFATECSLQAQMRHPHIVQLYGLFLAEGDEGEAPVMVSELMEETLRTRILRAPRLTVRDVIDMSLQIASAIRFLHEREEPIAHRDLSSNNVMLTPSGVCKVGDVGLAKVFTEARRVGTTVKPGTEQYMPGEVLSTGARYNEKLDVFSLGVLILEMSVGHEPRPIREFSRQEVIGGRTVYVPISEVERRKIELNGLGTDHPLRGLIEKMFDPQVSRPAIGVVYDQLDRLRSHPAYKLSTDASENAESVTTSVALDFREVRSQIDAVGARLDRLEGTVKGDMQANQKDLVKMLRSSLQRLEDANSSSLERLEDANSSSALLAQETMRELRKEMQEMRTARQQLLRAVRDGISLPAVDSSPGNSRAEDLPDRKTVDDNEPVRRAQPRQRQWQEQPDMPGMKAYCQTVQLNNWLVVLCGIQPTPCRRVFAFNTLGEMWKEWLPTPYALCAAASDGGQVIIAGGCPEEGGDAVGDVFRLNDCREWERLTEMPLCACQCAATIHNNRLYIFGTNDRYPSGPSSRATSTALQIFDIERAVWLAKECMMSSVSLRLSDPQTCGCLITLNNSLITDTLVCYNTEEKSSSDLPTRGSFRPHNNHNAMAVVNGQVIACGGVHFPTNEVHCLQEDKTWAKRPPMIISRRGASACALNGVLYIVGGFGHSSQNSNSVLSSMEAFL